MTLAVLEAHREIVKAALRSGVVMLCDVAWELRNGKLRSTTAITGQPPPATAAEQGVLEDSGPQHLPEFKYNREDGGQVSIAFLEAMQTNRQFKT